MNETEFTARVIEIARKQGFWIETNRSDQLQIDFGNKKLHEGHLLRMYPSALREDVNLGTLIESIAPGRPCTHRPMREILDELRSD